MTFIESDQPTSVDDGGKRRHRRSWSDEEKRRIVAECQGPGTSVSEVARRHDVNANQVFTWRRQFAEEASSAFVPVIVPPEGAGVVELEASTAVERPPITASPPPPEVSGRMEVVLEQGRRIIVDRTVSAAALSRVLGVLERRPAGRSLGEDRPVRRSPEGEGG